MERLEEKTLNYRFEKELSNPIFIDQDKIVAKSIYDADFFKENIDNFDKTVLENYFEAQHGLDEIFDNGYARQYAMARDRIFKYTKIGSTQYSNRAGDKLKEMLDLANIKFEKNQEFIFADVCSAPGAWTQCVLREWQNCKGVGMSMPIQGTNKERAWYPQLKEEPRFTITFGVDDTGNIYNIENIKKLRELHPNGYDLVMCDGGFVINKDKDGNHCEHLKEQITSRLLTGECIVALNSLKEGGHFICKMYDSLTLYSKNLLAIMCTNFKKLDIIKPAHSRITNSEKYVIFSEFVPQNNVIEYMIKFYTMFKEDQCYKSLLHECKGYDEFETFLKAINIELVERATKGLKLVVEETKKIIKNNDQKIIEVRRNNENDNRITLNMRQDNRYDRSQRDMYDYYQYNRRPMPGYDRYRYDSRRDWYSPRDYQYDYWIRERQMHYYDERDQRQWGNQQRYQHRGNRNVPPEDRREQYRQVPERKRPIETKQRNQYVDDEERRHEDE